MNSITRSEALVLGGDLEGLVAALTIARTGRRVVLICERPRPGGLHGSEQIAAGALETFGTLFDETRFPKTLIDELGLAAHGLRLAPAPDLHAIDRTGRHLRIARGESNPYAALPTELRDAATRFEASLRPHREWLRAELASAPPDLLPDGLGAAMRLTARASRLRALGPESLHELLWRLPTSVADWLGDSFEDRLLRATLAADALPGTWTGPRAAGTTAIWLLRDAARGVPSMRPVGGSPALVRALLQALREAGVRVHCGEALGGLLTTGSGSNSRVRGAWLADGSEFRADAVLSTHPPRRTLEHLAPAPTVDADAREALSSLRARGMTAVLDLAFDHEPRLACNDAAGFEQLRLLDDETQLEACADAVKHGRLAGDPWIEVFAARESDGRAVWTLHIHGVPHAPDGGWTVAARRELTDRVYAILGDASPNLAEHVRAERLRTPSDLARSHALAGGHFWQAELALDQLLLLRPTHELSNYRAPIAGLCLGSTAQHPGGLVPGLCGRLAAEVLEQIS